MATQFLWSSAKAQANLAKHGVSFQEALTVFGDPLARIHDDPGHPVGERRELIVGHSARGRLLLVSFNERGHDVRIISARKATRHERADYEAAAGETRG